jgi:hypothetical protein
MDTNTILTACDVGGVPAGSSDVQLMISEVLGLSQPQNDLNRDGVVNVLDIQKEINSAVGPGCQN